MTSSKVVPHLATVEVNRKIVIFPIDKTNQEIPKQWFNLIDLDQLHKIINNDAEHTGNKFSFNGETVRITLYGEAATSFEDSKIQSLLPPVFVTLTSLKVKQYQGNPVLGSTRSTVCAFNSDIPQFSQYKQKFEHLRSPVRILPTSAEMYTGYAVGLNYESKTIDELLMLDPALHKWYKSCPSCHKAVKKMSGSFECNEHGFTNQHNFLMIERHTEKILRVSCHTLVIDDRYEDPFVVPPALKKLVSEAKRLQLSFGNQNSKFRKTDFIIYGPLQD
ncbi:hypothetical protein DVH24_013742 [Malus domestica]|uniref:Replication factor A C-terminal domain-containing protein n=1 Tax=Malus domestica TaxID=3750 RepID=A0A498JDC7_MALDO|nr:hypothetical protein DVH24_013742 [Malus domestica]